MKITLTKKYLLLTVILFITEVIIAFFVYDKLIRNYIGDVLIVMLLYCFLKTFFNLSVLRTLICVLLFAYAVEVLQYFHLLELLQLQDSKVAALILGRNFTWVDIGAYTIGAVLVFIIKRVKRVEFAI